MRELGMEESFFKPILHLSDTVKNGYEQWETAISMSRRTAGVEEL